MMFYNIADSLSLAYLEKVLAVLPEELLDEFGEELSGTDAEWVALMARKGVNLKGKARVKSIVEQLAEKYGHAEGCIGKSKCTCWVGKLL